MGAAPFLRGYAKSITLTTEERERLAGLLFSRTFVDRVFRVCRAPETAPAAVKRFTTLRRTCNKQTGILLETLV